MDDTTKRDTVVDARDDIEYRMGDWCEQDTQYARTRSRRTLSEALDRYAAAVRAATVAECVAVVEASPRYRDVTQFGLTGSTMERCEGGSWIYDDDAIAALRALADAPTPAAVAAAKQEVDHD